MSLIKEVLRRRVPHVMAFYLGASWVLVEFIDFVTLRYALSPHLTDLTLLLPLLLLPSVILVAWFHGAPGKDEWVRLEKIGIPMNLVIAIAVLALMFRGKDLGAATTTVLVTDEEGVETERVIPKSEFRKRIAVYFFDAEPQDTAAAWLRYGLPIAIVSDLSQDHFIDVQSPPVFADPLREAGFADLVGVPLSLQRQIAEERHRGQFVTGTVRTEDGTIHAVVTLYDAATGRALGEHTLSGGDVLALADEVTLLLREDLEVPALGDGTIQDLPASEFLTSSPSAFRTFTDAVRTVQVERDFEKAAAGLARATAEDPAFAIAQYALAQLYVLSNRTSEAAAPLQAAMDNLYRISERARFSVKSDYYLIIRQDIDKALASILMWADLFPDDIAAYQARIQIQTVQDDKPGMLESLEAILEIDPGRREVLLQMGSLHEAMGDLTAAKEDLQRYADEFPEDHTVLTQLAGVARRMGNLEEAVALYDRATLLAPSDVGVMVGMGTALRSMGDFDGALEQYEAAMATSVTPEERARVHGALQGFYSTRGQMGRAIEHLESRMSEIAAYQPGLFAFQVKLRDAPGVYVEAGRDDAALAVIEDARAELPPPFDALVPMGEMAMHLAQEDADAIEATLPGFEALIRDLQYEVLRPRLVYAQGRMHELRGEYREAIERYEEERRLNPSDTSIPTQLGRCHRGLGEHDAAVSLIQESLRMSPFGPRTNYQMALTYEAMGRLDQARDHLQRSLEVWAEADADFRPAREAREASARMGG